MHRTDGRRRFTRLPLRVRTSGQRREVERPLLARTGRRAAYFYNRATGSVLAASTVVVSAVLGLGHNRSRRELRFRRGCLVQAAAFLQVIVVEVQVGLRHSGS